MSVLEGYANYTVAAAATGLLTHGGAIAEARRRQHEGEAGRLLEGLLGFQLSVERVEEASDFCAAVARDHGMATLNRMWESLETFPTREELARRDEWVRRMDTTPRGGHFPE
jgi:uncharacterized protein (DUF2342 family)